MTGEPAGTITAGVGAETSTEARMRFSITQSAVRKGKLGTKTVAHDHLYFYRWRCLGFSRPFLDCHFLSIVAGYLKQVNRYNFPQCSAGRLKRG